MRERKREREREQAGQGQKEREGGRPRTRSRLQAPGSRLRAVSTEPDKGLELTDHELMT